MAVGLDEGSCEGVRSFVDASKCLKLHTTKPMHLRKTEGSCRFNIGFSPLQCLSGTDQWRKESNEMLNRGVPGSKCPWCRKNVRVRQGSLSQASSHSNGEGSLANNHRRTAHQLGHRAVKVGSVGHQTSLAYCRLEE